MPHYPFTPTIHSILSDLVRSYDTFGEAMPMIRCPNSVRHFLTHHRMIDRSSDKLFRGSAEGGPETSLARDRDHDEVRAVFDGARLLACNAAGGEGKRCMVGQRRRDN